MPKLTPSHLQNLASHVKHYLGEYWKFEVFSAKQCAQQGHPYDPPCAYAEVTLAGGAITIMIDADGEWHIDPINVSGQMPDPSRTSGRYWITVKAWRKALETHTGPPREEPR